MVYPPNWLSAPLNRLSSTVNAVTVRTLPPHSTHPSKTTLLLSELPVYFRNRPRIANSFVISHAVTRRTLRVYRQRSHSTCTRRSGFRITQRTPSPHHRVRYGSVTLG